MSDIVWVLRHPTRPMTKTWKTDGSILNNEEGKLFIGEEKIISDMRAMSEFLTTLERQSRACIIRGEYLGYAHSKAVEPDDTKQGKVLRRKSVHKDIPHHWMLVDIDKYIPFDYEAMLEPVECINEFIKLYLPACFHGVSYHWQYSSSMGHPSKNPAQLRAHVWFWLKTPYNCAQLRAWAESINYKADKALFNMIQLHYTAAPVLEPGIKSPIRKRSGFYEGDFGDEVNLIIPKHVLDMAPDTGVSKSRHQKMSEAAQNDPVASLLYEKKMVKSTRSDGALNIICPRSDEHTSESAESATLYYPAHTGGHVNGNFVCLHDHCRNVPNSIFLDALGYVENYEGVWEAGDDDDDLAGNSIIERKIPEPKHLCTDQRNAERIMKTFEKKMLVVAGKWHVWDGKRWKRDDAEVYIKGMNLSKIIHKEADKWKVKKGKSADERQRYRAIAEQLEKWAKKSEMQGTINAALNMVSKVLNVDAMLMDNHPWLLNVRNGTVDLRTGKLFDHNPDDMITRLIDLDYNPDAKCPTWIKTLRMINREEDADYTPVSDFMQRWFGYCLTGSTREQCFVVHHGGGKNGKSTIIDTMTAVMGDYAGVAAPGLLMASGRERHPTEIADLFGRRMVTAHESSETGVLHEAFIKQATGSDKLKARFMAEDFFEWVPTHKIQLLTNHKPNVKGQDDGIWRRVLLIPYTAKFGTAKEVQQGLAHFVRDMTMPEKLQKELPGILAWAIQGCIEWFAYNLCPPDAVRAASRDYQTEQDRVMQFVNELCEVGKDKIAYLTIGQHGGIYPSYMRWCKVGGMHALNKNNFLAGLERIIPKFKKESKQVRVEGRKRSLVVLHGLSCPEPYEV